MLSKYFFNLLASQTLHNLEQMSGLSKGSLCLLEGQEVVVG